MLSAHSSALNFVERTIDLDAEMQKALAATRQIHLDWLGNLGVSSQTIANLGAKQAPFGFAKVELSPKGFYTPSTELHAIDAIVQPVVDEDTIVDLVVWRSLRPDDWRWRVGNGWALGVDAIRSPAPWDGFASIEIHSSPLEWLRSGGTGAVVLDWSATSHIRQLGLFNEIRCDDRRVFSKLKAILERPARMPRIIVDGTRSSHAAA